ncbi:uncharacterized protein LOC122293721 [Carya illinoinensis]|uniref:uncharacterized protein LOC122293721 n=1 Tax=Carya illinoinensis TaxID=32201 RepID=UPI001C72672D|nr:uncharacterized protein LOC122293721 [Carya illinoinensis]
MNEIEERWGRLRLTEEEASDIVIGEEVLEDLQKKAECSVVGKIWLDRRVSAAVVENTMGKVWRISRRAKFQEVGANIFAIQFANEADKMRVMDGRPWLFDSHLFIILPFNGLIPPQRMDFSKERMWIQMLEMPLVCMNEEEGKRIGNTIGEVIEVETQVDGSGWGSVLRVLLLMDLTKPLARGRTILVKGIKYWIPLRYEKLPHLCFVCGCIVHKNGKCGKKTGVEGVQFGAWLRADVRVGGSKFRSKTKQDYSKYMETDGIESDNINSKEREVRGESVDNFQLVAEKSNEIDFREGQKEQDEGLTEVLVEEAEVIARAEHRIKEGEIQVSAVEEILQGNGKWKRKARGMAGGTEAGEFVGIQERKRKSKKEKGGREKKQRKIEVELEEEKMEVLKKKEVEAVKQPHLSQ